MALLIFHIYQPLKQNQQASYGQLWLLMDSPEVVSYGSAINKVSKHISKTACILSSLHGELEAHPYTKKENLMILN
jgi:hypothetical protein